VRGERWRSKEIGREEQREGILFKEFQQVEVNVILPDVRRIGTAE
jgi:hypothetical protein